MGHRTVMIEISHCWNCTSASRFYSKERIDLTVYCKLIPSKKNSNQDRVYCGTFTHKTGIPEKCPLIEEEILF